MKDPLIGYTNGLPRGAVESCNHNHYQTKKNKQLYLGRGS